MNGPSSSQVTQSPAGFPLFGLVPWSVAAPLLALLSLLAGKPDHIAVALLLATLLGVTILGAVYHAEIVAHYLGEPFGTLVLALAVTVIETALIVSIMLSESAGTQSLARDTLIAAIMITMNGIVGLCLIAGGTRHHEQSYTQSGVSIGLAMLATLSVLTLVLPNYTTSAGGAYYSAAQLTFVAMISLAIYATFVVAQTIRHRDHFLHPETGDHAHEPPARKKKALAAGLMLLLALCAVVLLAKSLAGEIERAVLSAGAPKALVGIIIAALVLAPEGFAAVRAARLNRVQTSLNLAIGSALASIGLTIPAVAVIALLLGLDLELGLSMRSTVLLGLTLLVASLTLSTGRTTIAHGVIHLTILLTYLFTTLEP